MKYDYEWFSNLRDHGLCGDLGNQHEHVIPKQSARKAKQEEKSRYDFMHPTARRTGSAHKYLGIKAL